MTGESPYWEQFCDSPLMESSKFAEILCETKLESIGVCRKPSELQKSFQTFAPKMKSLRLLYLRFTGKAERKTKFFEAYSGNQGKNWREDEEKELEAFTDWAFGPDGFLHLQVLASGDFSYGNRFADTQTLWCRNTCDSSSKRL